MKFVGWVDFFGKENKLIEGKNDDIFLVVLNERNEEGDPYTRIISKKAIIEMADKLRNSQG